MRLLRLLIDRQRGWAFVFYLLNMAAGFLGIGVIAFINARLTVANADLRSVIPQFIGLLLLALALAIGAQIGTTRLGHGSVLRLRSELLKRVLDTPLARLEALGPARILASLANDVQTLSVAFVRLPAALNSGLLSLVGAAYLFWLAPTLFFAVALWLGIALGIAWWLLQRTHREVEASRLATDDLYDSYRAVLEGRKELRLNRERAALVYTEDFAPAAAADYRHQTRADLYNSAYGNWLSVMLLAAIGLVFFLARQYGWASDSVAMTFAVTLLYISAPLSLVVGTLPALLAGSVALRALDSLDLVDYRSGFVAPVALPLDWQRLRLAGLTFQYPGDTEPFAIGPLDLEIRRGEVIFLIGGNGSGKSSLARVLCGVAQPTGGHIYLDAKRLDTSDWPAYRQMFSAVFGDFHLFRQLLDGQGATPDPARVGHWLTRLELVAKVIPQAGRLPSTAYSQGQRKRLALLLAMLEQRPVLLLDEWAADQDPHYRHLFYTELLEDFRAAGKTVFAITHDERYFQHADRLLKMDGGRLIELHGQARQQASADALA